jgi:hypothetical protein
MVVIRTNPPGGFSVLSELFVTFGTMERKMTYFKTRSTTQGDSLKVKFLRPRVIFTSKNKFSWESFTQIHFHANAGKCRGVVPCSFATCEMEIS